MDCSFWGWRGVDVRSEVLISAWMTDFGLETVGGRLESCTPRSLSNGRCVILFIVQSSEGAGDG